MNFAVQTLSLCLCVCVWGIPVSRMSQLTQPADSDQPRFRFVWMSRVDVILSKGWLWIIVSLDHPHTICVSHACRVYFTMCLSWRLTLCCVNKHTPDNTHAKMLDQLEMITTPPANRIAPPIIMIVGVGTRWSFVGDVSRIHTNPTTTNRSICNPHNKLNVANVWHTQKCCAMLTHLFLFAYQISDFQTLETVPACHCPRRGAMSHHNHFGWQVLIIIALIPGALTHPWQVGNETDWEAHRHESTAPDALFIHRTCRRTSLHKSRQPRYRLRCYTKRMV